MNNSSNEQLCVSNFKFVIPSEARNLRDSKFKFCHSERSEESAVCQHQEHSWVPSNKQTVILSAVEGPCGCLLWRKSVREFSPILPGTNEFPGRRANKGFVTKRCHSLARQVRGGKALGEFV